MARAEGLISSIIAPVICARLKGDMKPVIVITLFTLVTLCFPLPVGAASRADVNRDGVVNILDVTAFAANRLANNNRYNVIADGRVDIFDFNAILASLNLSIATPTPTQTPPVGGKPTKKWHPGHYIYHKTGDLDPQVIKDYYKDPRYDATAGIYTQVYWKSLEAKEDVYTLDFIQQYLDALPDDKQLFIVFMDRDYRATSCATSRIPGWVDGAMIEGCVAKYWEEETMDDEIELLGEIAKRFDDHPQFEGVLLQETSFGGEEIGLTHDQMYEKYYELHQKSKGVFKKSHLLRNMNSLGGPEKSCKLLGQLTVQLEGFGYGMANPDSNAWDAMPWDCIGNDNGIGELPGDKVKPVYALYRKVGNRVPKLVGNDGSQLGDPDNPRMFNGERMNIPNLVKYHYLSAVKGYSHKDFGAIEPFGANYLMWLSDFWSKDSAKNNTLDAAMKEEWDDEVLKLINQPGHETNQTCPSNINCLN